MIFDWEENCKKIILTKHFPNETNQEKKNIVFQHIILFKYLEEKENMTKEQVKDFWLQTDSPILLNLPNDGRKEWIEIEFNKIWQMREKNRVNFLASNQMVYNFLIFQEEIDYINSLECSTWIKKALLLILTCAKHQSNNCLKYNNFTVSWIQQMIDPDCYVRNKMQKIGEVNSQYDLFDFVTFGFQTNRIKLKFLRKEGTICGVCYSPNYARDFLSLIEETNAVCPLCGKKFIKGVKSKTVLCKECYYLKRRENKKIFMRRKRASENTQ